MALYKFAFYYYYYYYPSLGPRDFALRGLGCSLFVEPKDEHFRSYISPIWGEKTWSDRHKILYWGDIQDVITTANFGDDQLGRFCVARGHFLSFSIGFRYRPYNTLALPGECVI